MKRHFVLALTVLTLIFVSCGPPETEETCCIIGIRNANGNISTSGAQKVENISKEECKRKCQELELAADWFNKACDKVKVGIGQFEKGEQMCP
jgi:hypothetical protein